MTNLTLAFGLSLAIAGISVPESVLAHAGTTDPLLIHACVKKRGKSVRIVSPGARKCSKGERAIHWSGNGPTGDGGAIGSVGPQGPAGADGATGPAGADGTDGVNGAIGPVGPQGPAGADGTDGVDGAPGPQGPAGPQGKAGADGTNGNDGAQGPKGDKGEQGNAGHDGVAGPPGSDGPPGLTGAAGAQGPKGDKGDQGNPGHDGVAGPPGSDGPPGLTGAAGAQGPKGDKGDQGNPGHDGVAGPPGSDGPPGLTGATGAQGPKGDKGDQGNPGHDGVAGPPGSNGPPGLTGAAGTQGPKGDKGNSGNVYVSQLFRTTPVLTLDENVNGESQFNVSLMLRRGNSTVEDSAITHAFSVSDTTFAVKLTAQHFVIPSASASNCSSSTACKIRVVAFEADTLVRRGVLGCFTVSPGNQGFINTVSAVNGGVGTVTGNSTANLVMPDVAGLYHLLLDATDSSLDPLNTCSSAGDWHALNVPADSVGLISVQ